MRMALLITVVMAHIVLAWFFLKLRPAVVATGEDPPFMILVLLPQLAAENRMTLPWNPSVETLSESLSVPAIPVQREEELQQEPLDQAEGSGYPDVLLPDFLQVPDFAREDGSQQEHDLQQSPDLRRPDFQSSPGLQQASPGFPLITPGGSSAPHAMDWRAQVAITAESSAQHIVTAEDENARQAGALTAPFKPMPGPRKTGPSFAWDLTPRGRLTAIGHGAFVMPLNNHCAILVLIVPMIGCSVGFKYSARGDLFKYMHGPVKYGDWDWRVQDP